MDQKTDPVCLPITEEYYGMATFLLSFHFSIEMHSPSEIHVSLHSTFRKILYYLMLRNDQACYLMLPICQERRITRAQKSTSMA